jgi:uncharacterized spore protein YtfJ
VAKKNGSRKGPRVGGLRGVLQSVTGARLCYGEPVTVGNRTVIPVSRLTTVGGWGWGGGGDGSGSGSGSGGGGGGTLEATPVGFIEFDDVGARYHEIHDPDQLGRTLRAAAGAAATAVTTIAGARALRRGAGRALPRRTRRTPVRRMLGRGR